MSTCPVVSKTEWLRDRPRGRLKAQLVSRFGLVAPSRRRNRARSWLQLDSASWKGVGDGFRLSPNVTRDCGATFPSECREQARLPFKAVYVDIVHSAMNKGYARMSLTR